MKTDKTDKKTPRVKANGVEVVSNLDPETKAALDRVWAKHRKSINALV